MADQKNQIKKPTPKVYTVVITPKAEKMIAKLGSKEEKQVRAAIVKAGHRKDIYD